MFGVRGPRKPAGKSTGPHPNIRISALFSFRFRKVIQDLTSFKQTSNVFTESFDLDVQGILDFGCTKEKKHV